MPEIELTEAPDFGQAFKRSLHDFIVLITGLDKKNVRPNYQFEPPLFGDFEEWCSFSTPKSDLDSNFFERVDDKGNYESREQEELTVRVSFYGPNSKKTARIFTAGLKRPDYWTDFFNATGCRLLRLETVEGAPDMIDGHWVAHSDVSCTFRRETVWKYSGISEVSEFSISTEEG